MRIWPHIRKRCLRSPDAFAIGFYDAAIIRNHEPIGHVVWRACWGREPAEYGVVRWLQPELKQPVG